jgi:hypothetical protein
MRPATDVTSCLKICFMAVKALVNFEFYQSSCVFFHICKSTQKVNGTVACRTDNYILFEDRLLCPQSTSEVCLKQKIVI